MAMTTYKDLANPESLKFFSRDAILRARPPVIWRRFAEEKQDLLVQPGNEVVFRILGGFPVAKHMKTEHDKIPTYKRENGEVGIKVYPMGIATENSEFSVDFSNRDEIADNALMFALNYHESIDNIVKTAFLSGSQTWFGGGKPNRAAITPADKLKLADLKAAKSILKDFSKNTPPFIRDGKEHYIFVGTERQISQLMDDPDFRETQIYTILGVTQLYAGEVGMIHGIVCIEAPTAIFPGQGASAQDIHQGVLFGPWGVGLAIGREFEMRADPPADLGTKIRTGWVAVNGAGILADDYLIKIETSV